MPGAEAGRHGWHENCGGSTVGVWSRGVSRVWALPRERAEQGVFVLSEKIQFEDDAEQTWMTELHHDFKKAYGYSDLEISQKRSALENVLIPESVEVHVARLKSAGFKQVFTWFQCFNFVSILAIK